jgi:hypothetical protein
VGFICADGRVVRFEVALPYTALLSIIRRLFAFAPLERADGTQASSAPMSDQELSRAIKDLRDSAVADGVFQRARASGEEKKSER